MAKTHFISGLPRSGSTLLAALLRQNPRFEAGMSGPLAGLFGALLGQMSARNEYSVFIDDARRERILRGLFDSFYADCKAGVIFDTSRGWYSATCSAPRRFSATRLAAPLTPAPTRWLRQTGHSRIACGAGFAHCAATAARTANPGCGGGRATGHHPVADSVVGNRDELLLAGRTAPDHRSPEVVRG